MIRTPQQNKQLHALVGKLNLEPEIKQELVYQYSQGRTCKSSELTIPECQALINALNHQVKLKASNPINVEKPGEKMRRKILSICHEMNWKLVNGKIDINRVNKFCEDRTYLHKRLNDYTPQELPQLVTQFEKVLKTYYNGKAT